MDTLATAVDVGRSWEQSYLFHERDLHGKKDCALCFAGYAHFNDRKFLK